MPDWSWPFLVRPALRGIGAPGRRTALGAASVLTGLPGGRAAVRIFAGIEPPSRSLPLPRPAELPPVGLSVPLRGLAAAEALGFGVLVVGPLRPDEIAGLRARLGRLRRTGVAVLVRLADAGDPATARLACVAGADAVVIPVGSDLEIPDGTSVVLAGSAIDLRSMPARAGVAGLLVEGGDEESVRELRREHPGRLVLASGAGCPGAAARLVEAGADVVVYPLAALRPGGPGLAQRTAEAVAPSRPAAVAAEFTPDPRRWPPWVWAVLLSAGMIAGGLGAALIGLTRVLLPYDEDFVGLDREAVGLLNGRLLDFLRHDRVTLAGTLLSIGVVYLGLSVGALRHGERWARRALLVSGSVGFASLFLFLGFGYFDPLHGALTAALFPVFVLAVQRPEHEHAYPARTDTGPEDARRRRGLLGQLMLVALAGGLLVGGTAISLIGIGGVFVPSDLAFLSADRVTLTSTSDRLLSLVAHDRAGFGGALVSDALALLLVALWGYRPGARWLWWTVCLAGLAGTCAALGIHVAVGYTDPFHLAPVLLEAVLLLAFLVVSRPYLCREQRAERRLDVQFPIDRRQAGER